MYMYMNGSRSRNETAGISILKYFAILKKIGKNFWVEDEYKIASKQLFCV